jgi:hypothetical protein
LDRVEAPAFRYRVYALIGLSLFALALLKAPVKNKFNFVISDGRFYYVYLPSLVIDGDLDFTNQMREHWDGDWYPPFDEYRTERGLVANKYPIGVALTVTPSFLLGHAVALISYHWTGAGWCAPDGYSVPYQVCNLLFLLVLGACTMVLADRLLTRWFRVGPVSTFLAVVTFWLGSHYQYYYLREQFMAHLAGTFWVTAALVLLCTLLDEMQLRRLSGWRLFLFTFSVAMALICRPTNAFLLPFCVYLLYRVVRAGLLGRFLRLTPAIILGMAPVFVQMAVWYALYGHAVVYSYGGEGFRWTEPAAWQTLFSSRHGLFFWSPLLLAAMGGVVWRLRKGEPLVLCYVAAFLLLWYCNSCWGCWWFGHSFGGRAFLELSSLFVLGLGSAFEAVRRAGRRTELAFGAFVAVCMLYHWVLMGLYVLQLIPHGDPLF